MPTGIAATNARRPAISGRYDRNLSPRNPTAPQHPARYLIRYALFAGFLLAFTAALEAAGGLAGLWWHKVIELPMVLYLYFLVSQLLRRDRVGALVAAVPVVLGYAFMDLYYFLFGRVWRVSELGEVPELLDVVPWYITGALAVTVALPLVLILTHLRPRPLRRLLVASLPFVALTVLLVQRPDLWLGGFAAAANGVVEWSDEENVRWNGRFTSVLYQEARRRAAIRSASEHLDEPEYRQGFEATVAALKEGAKPRNVYLLVLEGFVDPARLEHLKLDRDALHPRFRALLHEGRGDLAVAPVFGGYTAQAEFEILCGVPALQVLGTIEFNLFSGAPVHCLPDVLGEVGYLTIASEGYKPDFFNEAVALKAVGFEQVHFPQEYAPQRPSYFSTGDVSREKYMFDATLLEQNLEYVRQHLAASPGRPLLNYVMTVYGHYPYQLDETVRPRVVQVQSPLGLDPQLLVILNQLYYRSIAIADYVEGLMALDPDGLILMLGDHLPPFEGGVGTYQRLGYLGGKADAEHRTLLSVLDRGRILPLEELHQYDIPALVYRLLTDGGYCETGRCEPRGEQELRRDYLQVMAHAVGG